MRPRHAVRITPTWAFAALRWAGLVAAAVAIVVVCLAVSVSNAPARSSIAVFLLPHPDDEFEMWSLVEGRPQEFKLFVTLTHGEQSRYCDPAVWQAAFDPDDGALRPDPPPQGKWTPSCAQARINAQLGFFRDMSLADPTIPGEFDRGSSYGPYDADVPICRVDDDRQMCGDAQRSVRVWLDARQRGALVLFDLGDGDLTEEETAWAIRTTLNHGSTWGLPAIPVTYLAGGYAYTGRMPCFTYPHPDHLALDRTLWGTDFGAGPQLGATCFLDKRQNMSAKVSGRGVSAALGKDANGHFTGANLRHYGWLNNDMRIFPTFQTFWIRFAS